MKLFAALLTLAVVGLITWHVTSLASGSRHKQAQRAPRVDIHFNRRLTTCALAGRPDKAVLVPSVRDAFARLHPHRPHELILGGPEQTSVALSAMPTSPAFFTAIYWIVDGRRLTDQLIVGAWIFSTAHLASRFFVENNMNALARRHPRDGFPVRYGRLVVTWNPSPEFARGSLGSAVHALEHCFRTIGSA